MWAVAFLAVSAATWSGCGGADDEAASANEVVTSADCRIFLVQEQRLIAGKELEDFSKAHASDPVLANILKGSCPGTYREVQATLDRRGCVPNTRFRLVSERANQLGHPDESRLVIDRNCGTS